ncbi:hypothetical protein BGV60_02695 [Burkholderia ubonensis]|nr:hypothetical protein BGV59_05370 [Burkholderia ubonensis]OJB64624.1 hypothetical protein BGV60_02695 [Burkholderia ubonensis]
MLGEAGVEELLATTIAAAANMKMVETAEFKAVIVDTTVQEKAVAFSTDSRLLEVARAKLVKLAQRAGLTLKQTYEREGKWLRRQAVEPIIGHVKQDHRLRRWWLKGASGDALHAMLCATGFNLRWLLRAMARLGVGPVLLRWLRHVKRAAFAHDLLTIARQLRVGAPMCSPFRSAAALTCTIQLATSSRCAPLEAAA